jgi:hypothetical protein
MSDLIEQFEDSKKALRMIKETQKLPIVYHPDHILRPACDGRLYRTSAFRGCSDIAPSQPPVDVSLLKIDAVVSEGAAAHAFKAIHVRLCEHYNSIPPLDLPPRALR